MEPPQIAVQALGGDTAEALREALDLAVAAVDRLDVHGPANPLRRRGLRFRFRSPLRLLSTKVSTIPTSR